MAGLPEHFVVFGRKIPRTPICADAEAGLLEFPHARSRHLWPNAGGVDKGTDAGAHDDVGSTAQGCARCRHSPRKSLIMDTALAVLNLLTTPVGDLVLSVAGLGLSIWAMLQAGGAKRAVSKVLARNNDQVTRDNARDLLIKLTTAKDAAMARRQGAPRSSTAGRVMATDLEVLQLAQDALATSTLGTGQSLAVDLQRAAVQLNSALQGLAGNSVRDEWADALGVLQGIIPKVDVLQAELAAKVLR